MTDLISTSTIAKQERVYTEKEHHELVAKLNAAKIGYNYWTALIKGKLLVIGAESKDLPTLQTKVTDETSKLSSTKDDERWQ